ncbi:MAG: hypothetical protein WBG08_13570 [Litorimonas sp.]
MRLRFIPLVFMTLVTAGCSTIDRGAMDHVRVDTVPQGQPVTLSYLPQDTREGPRQLTCRATPCAFEIRRAEIGVVRIAPEGYEPVEYFVGPSRLRGGAVVDPASSATVLGVSTVVGIQFAITQQLFLGVTDLLINTLTFGLSNTATPAPSTATGAGVGLGIGAGMVAGGMMIDAGTAANRNVYPSPVVVKLQPTGTDIKPDPFVAAYRSVLETREARRSTCTAKDERPPASPACRTARSSYRTALKTLTEMRQARDREALDALRDLRERVRATLAEETQP